MGGGCRKSCPSLVAGNPNLFAGKILVAIATQKRGEYVGFFVFLVNLVDFKRFSLTCKGFKEKFYDILLKVCTKRFSESSSVTGNDERRPKDGKFPTAVIFFSSIVLNR